MTVNFRQAEFSQGCEGNVSENALASKMESFSRSNFLAFLVMRGDLSNIFPTERQVISPVGLSLDNFLNIRKNKSHTKSPSNRLSF